MKKISTPLYGLIVLAMLLSACNLPFGSAAAPTEVPLATLELPPTPTIEPIVPEAPTIGSTISWFDTSTLVYVPGGEFVMGADEPEKQDFNPAHPVSMWADSGSTAPRSPTRCTTCASRWGNARRLSSNYE